MELQKIRWIASYPKSGNTWVRMATSAYLTGGVLDINDPLYVRGNDFSPGYWQMSSAIPWVGLNQEQVVYLRPAALLNMCAMHPGTMPLFVKTHSANIKLIDVPLIPQLLSHSAVYLVRDPRDVAVSWSEHLQIPIDHTIEKMEMENLAIKRTDEDTILQNLCSWSKNVDSWLTAKGLKVLVVKYEDMLRNPVDIFSQILKHWEIPVDMDLVAGAIETTKLEKLAAQEKEHGFREAQAGQTFFRHGKSGVWKDTLTPEQIKKIEEAHGPTMKKLGYL